MRELRSEGTIYEVERAVGQGQTATVFRALRKDSRGYSRQIVALKILRSPHAVPWLRREFETLARVSSPHLVRVLGWDNFDEGCALVLEWVDGITLLELGRSVRLSDELVEEILAQAQDGLKALHQSGLHHGDLSPANILIDRTGCLKLVDFATALADGQSIIGTPPYIAPEIWSSCGQTSPAADLYSLGLIEIDTRQGFSFVPRDSQASFRRATEVLEQNCLLAADPSSRQFSPIQSIPERRATLASAVSRILDSKLNSAMTAVIPLRRSFSQILVRSICLAVAASFVAALPVGAQAPLEILSSPAASLVVRTHKWMEITLGGRNLGYTPIEMMDLKEGEYLLKWRTRTTSGEKKIILRPGQALRLLEADLVASDAPRKR